MSALDYLLKQEWSMGNGQCPECCGVPESWHGHPLHMTPDTIGHQKKCKLAASIKELGGTPLMIGDFKSTKVFKYEWGEGGILTRKQIA